MARILHSLVIATLAMAPAFSNSQSSTPEQRAAAKQKWDSKTPEEKQAAKAKAKAKWDSMTPEEQAKAKQRFAEKHPKAAQKAAQPSQAPASAAK